MKIPRRTRNQAVIPLTSTADVAFLLLIFFIVLAKDASESAVQWTPASTTMTLVPNPETTVSVIVDKNQQVFVDGHPVSQSGVGNVVGEILGSRPAGNRRVIIKIDKDVPEKVFGQVMLDIGDAGGEMFRVLEMPPAK